MKDNNNSEEEKENPNKEEVENKDNEEEVEKKDNEEENKEEENKEEENKGEDNNEEEIKEEKNKNEDEKEEGDVDGEEVKFIPKEKISKVSVINSRDTKDSLIENDEKEEEEEYHEKTCSMQAGSIQGGVFALSSLALGTGAFSIPIRCTQFGCVWYMVFIVLGAGACYWTLSGLIKAARKVKGKDYSSTVRAMLGNCPAKFIDYTIIIYLFGIFVQYQVIIYSLIGRTIYEFAIDKTEYPNYEDYETKEWDSAKYKYPIMFGTIALVIPLCLLKDISKMRFASMFAICALIYCILVVVIESPWFFSDYLDKYNENDPATHANWLDMSRAFTKDLNFFTGLATVFFVYSCQAGAFPVYKTLKNNTEKRINSVFFRSVCLDIIIYIFISICGFMTAPTNPKSLIIYRDSIFENDIFMTIAKIALAIDLFLSLPANFVSFRCSFFLVIFKTDQIDNKRNWLVTLPTLLLSTLTGALYKEILDYISLFGGFCSSIMCFILPGALMIKSSGEKITSKKNIITFIIVAVLSTVGFMGGIQTIRGIITR